VRKRGGEKRRPIECSKKIVFVLFVSWRREGDSVRTPEQEYATVKAKLPEGTGLFTGCSESMVGGVEYDAVVVLRGRLATIGDLVEWFDLGAGGAQGRWTEPEKGQKLKGFLDVKQQYCGRGGETYGSRIVMSEADAATWMMLQRLAAREREGRKSVERLTGLMRDLQQADEMVNS